jgi:hypothetical protein
MSHVLSVVPAKAWTHTHRRPCCYEKVVAIASRITNTVVMGPRLRGDDGGDVYDDRMSSSRRPSVFNNFFTALEAATSPLLA